MPSMWDYGNDRSVQPSPATYTQGYPGHGPTKIDLKYKVPIASLFYFAMAFHVIVPVCPVLSL